MAGNDVAMGGGGGVGGWWAGRADAEVSSAGGSQSGEGSNASTPLPRIVSDIVGPGRPPATSMAAATHQQGGARQAAAVTTTPALKSNSSSSSSNNNNSSNGQSFAEIPPHTPRMPSGNRLAVLIKQSPSSSSSMPTAHFPSSTTTMTAAKMKRPPPTSTTTAASARDQRVATTPPTKATATPGLPKSDGQRPRGRPKGWKPGMSYVDVDVDVDATPPPPPPLRRAGPGRPPLSENSEARLRKRQQQQQQQQHEQQRRRGRPPRPSERSAREQYLRSKPSFTRFLCEWVGEGGRRCPAELQNLATLRRHVYLVHGGEGDADNNALVCRWGKCARRTPPEVFAADKHNDDDDNDDDDGGAAAFEEHFERTHLRPFAWHVGDGVQNEGIIGSVLGLGSRPEAQNGTGDANGNGKKSDSELPAYLFKDGVQVTPSVRDQRPEDEQRMRERKRKLRRLLIQRDEDAPDEEEYMLQTLGVYAY